MRVCLGHRGKHKRDSSEERKYEASVACIFYSTFSASLPLPYILQFCNHIFDVKLASDNSVTKGNNIQGQFSR